MKKCSAVIGSSRQRLSGRPSRTICFQGSTSCKGLHPNSKGQWLRLTPFQGSASLPNVRPSQRVRLSQRDQPSPRVCLSSKGPRLRQRSAPPSSSRVRPPTRVHPSQGSPLPQRSTPPLRVRLSFKGTPLPKGPSSFKLEHHCGHRLS